MPHNGWQWVTYALVVLAGALLASRMQKYVMRVQLDPERLIKTVLKKYPAVGKDEFKHSRHVGTLLQDWVGVIEIILYASSVVFEHPEFIAVWFATKYVSSYHTWSRDPVGRSFYNRSLFGSGLNILIGYFTGRAALWAIQHATSEGGSNMGAAWYWIAAHLDRIFSFAAIAIAVIAMLDVRSLFKELERRDKDTEHNIRQGVLKELLTHTASFATFSRAAQFIDFNEGQPDKQTAIAMLMAFRLQQLIAPDATKEEFAELRRTTRNQIEQESKIYAETIIASGLGKLKDGWDISQDPK
jgi:hypothetical protein